MDKLETLRRFERRGGVERRHKARDLILAARKFGCRIDTSDGKKAALRLRFGGLEFDLLKVEANGTIRVFADPCSGISGSSKVHDEINAFLEANEELSPSTMPVRHHSAVEENLDDVPLPTLLGLLTTAIDSIRQNVYGSHRPVIPIPDPIGATA